MSAERSRSRYIEELEEIAKSAIKRADEQTIKKKLEQISKRLDEEPQDKRS